jgi:uncharacterized protein YqcC (DUF446 family)
MSSALLDKLNQVEAEMKRIGYWQENPPDLRAKYASGEMRSYLDAPSFELWLSDHFPAGCAKRRSDKHVALR